MELRLQKVVGEDKHLILALKGIIGNTYTYMYGVESRQKHEVGLQLVATR